jgi:uncharacterized membrane protein YidH (DUF202 family)
MTTKRIIGIILLVIGIVAMASGGVWWTRDKKVIDAGPLQVHTQEHKGFAVPPVVGILALVGGLVLLVIPDRRRA